MRNRTKLRKQGYRYNHELGAWEPHALYYNRRCSENARLLAVLREGKGGRN